MFARRFTVGINRLTVILTRFHSSLKEAATTIRNDISASDLYLIGKITIRMADFHHQHTTLKATLKEGFGSVESMKGYEYAFSPKPTSVE